MVKQKDQKGNREGRVYQGCLTKIGKFLGSLRHTQGAMTHTW